MRCMSGLVGERFGLYTEGGIEGVVGGSGL